MTSSRMNGLNIGSNTSPKWDSTRCLEECAYSDGKPHLLQIFLLKISPKSFQFGNKVTAKWNVWSMEGVTVYDHASINNSFA